MIHTLEKKQEHSHRFFQHCTNHTARLYMTLEMTQERAIDVVRSLQRRMSIDPKFVELTADVATIIL